MAADRYDAGPSWSARYESRTYIVEPHWHVRFGRSTETLVYAADADDIAAWLKRYHFMNKWLFDGRPPTEFTARACPLGDCKPRPQPLSTVEEFLRDPRHGWWRRVGLEDL